MLLLHVYHIARILLYVNIGSVYKLQTTCVTSRHIFENALFICTNARKETKFLPPKPLQTDPFKTRMKSSVHAEIFTLVETFPGVVCLSFFQIVQNGKECIVHLLGSKL